jgi:D-alanyl-D-alanine endopeptidase (penicillin-binding protein 7)
MDLMTHLCAAPRCRPSLVFALLTALALPCLAPLPAAAAHHKQGRPAMKHNARATSLKAAARSKRTAAKKGKKAAVHCRRRAQRVAPMKGNLPNVQSLGALVIDLDTGHQLFARKPDTPRSIASISKLAAVLVVMDHAPPLEGLTTINKVDCDVARGGARSRLLEGMTLSNRDLLHASLLGSDNRAISALGRAVGLRTMQLAAAMNRKVTSLGLRHTRFREPTGLSADNQSTPRETLALLKAAMANPVLGPILCRAEYDAHPVSKPPIHYNNTNRPAARRNVQILGGKTGYNSSARYCLVLAARIGEHNYGMALLGTDGELTRFGDVARVADWIVVHQPKLPAPGAPQGPPPPEAILGPSPDASATDGK